MRVAIVVDHLESQGGVERFVEAVVSLWPDVTIIAPFISPKGRKKWAQYSILESWLSCLIRFGLPKEYLIPLLPFVLASFNFEGFDVVLSSHAWMATSIVVPKGVPHICYCHTPPRFLWGYSTESHVKASFLFKLLTAPLVSWLRLNDYFAAQRVTQFVTNSKNVKRRIKKFYRRDALVVPCAYDVVKKSKKHPLQDLALNSGGYYLVVARLVAYKNVDLVVKACSSLGFELVVVGDGPQRKSLKGLAGPTVHLLGFVDDPTLAALYQNCKAVIFPCEDDFGNVPVEAMQAGKPVIALGKGGVLETVIPGQTGEFFYDPTVEALFALLKKFDQRKYSQLACYKQGSKFSKTRFLKDLKRIVEQAATMVQ